MSKKKISKSKKKSTSKSEKPKQSNKPVKKKKDDVDMVLMDENYDRELEEILAEITQEEESLSEDLGGYTFGKKKMHTEKRNGSSFLHFNKFEDEVDSRKIRRNLIRAHAYMKKLGIEELEINSKQNTIIIPFTFEELEFLAHIIIGPEWYIIKTSVMELENLPQDLIFKIYDAILKANFILSDVTYSLDPEGKSVWCESDIPSNINYENFKLEYLSIVYGIDYFIKEIASKVVPQEAVQSTFHPEKRDPGHLYI